MIGFREDPNVDPEFHEVVIKPTGGERSRDLMILIAWERLRIVYNLVLIAFAIMMILAVGTQRLADIRFLEYLAFGTFMANLCFCAGPVADGYLHLLGMGGRGSRLGLFVAGLMLSIVLTLVAILLFDPT